MALSVVVQSCTLALLVRRDILEKKRRPNGRARITPYGL